MIWQVDVRRTYPPEAGGFVLDVSFRSAAARVVLFGPSGSGKSQTLKAIAGLARPDGGRIAIADTVLFDASRRLDVPARDRRLAYLFQDYALFPHLTVVQNVAFGLRGGWLNPGRSPRDESVRRWIDAFGLGPVADLHPHQLSGGQRQRAALARALAPSPRALLLDEPFAALDASLRARLRDELDALLGTLDTPMILISHDEEDVRRFGDDVIRIDGGRVATGVG